jgi:hypothetical protein
MFDGKDVIGYVKRSDFKSIVLEEMLKFVSDKYNFNVIKMPNKKWEPPAGSSQLQHPNRKLKVTKIALNSSLDSESEKIIHILIEKKAGELKSCFPVVGKEVKPLYLFLDSEILLFAKLKGLKFKEIKKQKEKIEAFADEFEKYHPEVKRAVVNSVLKLYSK